MTSDSTSASGLPVAASPSKRPPRELNASDRVPTHEYEDPEEEEAAELDEPGDPESLGSRIMRPRTLVSFAIAVLIVYFVFKRLDIDPGDCLE